MDNKELETQDTVMTPDVYRKTFWRTFPLQACFCFERMQNVGFAYMMIPALKKLYKNKKDIQEAKEKYRESKKETKDYFFYDWINDD